MEEKKYTKLGIFLFFFFVVLFIVFSTSTISLISGLFNGISQKNMEFKCTDLSYIVDQDSISYKSGNLVFEVSSKNYNTNITKIRVMPDTAEENFSIALSPAIKGGESRYVTIMNISLENGFYIELNDCNGKVELINLK